MVNQFDQKWFAAKVLEFMGPFNRIGRSVCRNWRDCRVHVDKLCVSDVTFKCRIERICVKLLGNLVLNRVSMAMAQWNEWDKLESLRGIEIIEYWDDYDVVFKKYELLERIVAKDCVYRVIHGRIMELKNLDFLRDMMEIRVLDLGGCNLINDFGVIGCLRKLKELRLDRCQVCELDFLENNVELEELSLCKCLCAGEDDFGIIGRLEKLRRLRLKGCYIGGLNFLRDNVELEELDLGEVKVVVEKEGEFIVLKYLKKLRKLCLEGCCVVRLDFLDFGKDCDIEMKLEDLNLSFCPHIGSDQFRLLEGKHLMGMTNLNLSNSMIDNLSFCGSMTELKILNLGGCRLLDYDQIVKIGTLMKLEELNLSNCRIEDMRFVCGMVKLEYLDLSGCNLRNVGWIEGMDYVNMDGEEIRIVDEKIKKGLVIRLGSLYDKCG